MFYENGATIHISLTVAIFLLYVLFFGLILGTPLCLQNALKVINCLH